MRIDIIVFDGLDELDAIGPYEVFSTAASFGADLDVMLVRVRGEGAVTGAHGLSFLPHRNRPRMPELIVVPGGGWASRPQHGAWQESQAAVLPALLRELYESGTTIAGVCTGVMLLASSGLLGGRPAVTHVGVLDELAEMGATVLDARVVDDGQIITAGGVTAAMDMAYWVVASRLGADVARQVADEMEFQPRGPVWANGAMVQS